MLLQTIFVASLFKNVRRFMELRAHSKRKRIPPLAVGRFILRSRSIEKSRPISAVFVKMDANRANLLSGGAVRTCEFVPARVIRASPGVICKEPRFFLSEIS
jgi:hypothetical protein